MAKLKRNPRVGRPRRYDSGKELLSEIEKYFASISYVEPVRIQKPVTEEVEGKTVFVRDNKGHILTELVAVQTLDGKIAEKVCWTEPPSIESMQVFLGISKSTWCDYAKDEEYSEAITYARGRVEAYLATIGITDPKTARAAEFSLMHNFGWKNESKMEVSGGVEDYLRKLDEEGKGQEM